MFFENECTRLKLSTFPLGTMTATSAGTSLVAKGLDISLAALQRQDPYINNIVDVASQVALYTYNNRANEWEKTEVEGTLFIYTRLASPRHGFTIMNRLSMENLTEPITKDLDFQLQDPFLLYRNARLVIHGIWFYDKEDCQRIAQRMKFLTHQEQLQAQSQGGWLSPGGNEGKTVDIIQMLSKARTEYDKEKSSSEPKEIGGSSVLYGNPNLIKPIPLKPNSQENEGGLSLATLFGIQQKDHSPQPAPGSSSSSNFGKITRPPVARTLTYDNAKTSGHSDTHRDGPREDGAQQQQQQQSQSQQQCPAIQKLMQGQRGVLQTVSESPENRLCDNGLQIDHQRVYQPSQPPPPPHHLHHHHLHHQQQQIQLQLHNDPIKRLFQSQPPVCAAAPCCAGNLPQNQPMPASHHQPLPNQPLIFNRPPGESHQHECHLATAAPLTVFPGQMPGVVSPHELLQKLQIVQQQQQQSLTPGDPPQLGPALAPRFMSPSQTDARQTGPNQIPIQPSATAGQKAALQFQVISPQRIPATVAPMMLLSPSVFTQTKPSAGLPPAQDSRSGPSNPVQILSRSQLQATLLHLIQNDSSFLDSIYEAYTSRISSDPCHKY